jgi:hypothetical protein
LSKKHVLLVALAALVLLSGCIKIQIREDISSSGMSDLTMSLEPVNVSAMGWDKKNPCDEFKPNESAKVFTNAKCKFDGKKETVTGRFDRKKAGGLTITGTKYRFDLVNAMEGFNDNKSAKSTFTLQKEKNQTQIQQARDSGFAYDYVVKLPGKVTSQSGGKIQSDGSVKFDLLELVDGDHPYVESDSGVGGLLGGLGGNKDTGTKETTKTTAKGKTGAGGASKIPCVPALTAMLAAFGAVASKVLQG